MTVIKFRRQRAYPLRLLFRLLLHLVPDRAAKLQRQFGSTVRAERKSRNLTQENLAFEAGLSLTYIGEIERGQRMVSLDTLRRIAGALNLTSAELLERARL